MLYHHLITATPVALLCTTGLTTSEKSYSTHISSCFGTHTDFELYIYAFFNQWDHVREVCVCGLVNRAIYHRAVCVTRFASHK